MQLNQALTVLRHSAEVLTADSLRCLEETNARIVYLDLGDVEFPTAGGLGALATLNKMLRTRGGELVLLNVSAVVYEVFLLTHLVEVLSIAPSVPPKVTNQVKRLFA